jgi:hypothetical protein
MYTKDSMIENICNICFDVTNDPRVTASCIHLFCYQCISKWIFYDFILNTKTTCPVCCNWVEFTVLDNVLEGEQFKDNFELENYKQLEGNKIEKLLRYLNLYHKMNTSKVF